jgi:predicted DNA-binding WGR domain protein
MGWCDRYKEEKIVVQRSGNHNKFWAAWWDENTNQVHVRWGRIGTKGQSQTKDFPSRWQATNFIDNKYNEKRRKGYTHEYNGEPITQEVLDALFIEAAIVGSQNKCDGMQWVEIESVEGSVMYAIVPDSRLADPECDPGLLVRLTTRKEYDGRTQFRILFTEDAAWLETSLSTSESGRCGTRIQKGHSLHKLVEKVEEAVGRSLS